MSWRRDSIWCCASLLHVPLAELPDALRRLARALKPGGSWYVSFKYGEGERAKEGRRFTDLNEAGLTALVAPLASVQIKAMWQTGDKRPDRDETWLNALLRKPCSPRQKTAPANAGARACLFSCLPARSQVVHRLLRLRLGQVALPEQYRAADFRHSIIEIQLSLQLGNAPLDGPGGFPG